MSTFENLSNNIREGLDHLAEGWQHLWHKARQSITRYTPSESQPDSREDISENDSSRQLSLGRETNYWGVLSAEVIETNREIEIHLEAPGMNTEDFQISIDNLTLSISGEKHYERDSSDGQYHVSERAYGRFERSIPLPSPVDASRTKASYHNGVLLITAPKASGAKGRRIVIENGG